MFDSTGSAARERFLAIALLSALTLSACGGDDGGDEGGDGGGQDPNNRAPTLSGLPPTSIVAGDDYLFQPSASDADGDALLFGVDGLPAWAEFDATTGTLSGVPGAEDVGTYRGIVVWVTDGETETLLPAFDIVVAPREPTGNRPPELAGTPAGSVVAGETYRFVPQAEDADGDSLSFGIRNRPSWASFDDATGTLEGVPTNADAGRYRNIVISVSDGQATTTLPPFSIRVTTSPPPEEPPPEEPPPEEPPPQQPPPEEPPPEEPPPEEPPPQEPPPEEPPPEEPPPANTRPTITGTPPSTVQVGEQYRFRPTARDADGDTLTFDIVNAPEWADFDESTGRLSGTPGAGDVRTWSDIRISVSDGEEVAWLDPFSITVEAVATGSATLTWNAPTRRTDGSPLDDLAKYKVYWGRSAGNYSNQAEVPAGTTLYVVDNLSAGTWYFATTAVDSNGIESDYSNVASKTIE